MVFIVSQLLLWTYFGGVIAGLLHVLAAVVYGLASGPLVSTLTWTLACGMPCTPLLSALSVLSYVDNSTPPRSSATQSKPLPPFLTR